MSLRRGETQRDRKVIEAALAGRPLHLVIAADGRIEAEEVAEAVQAEKDRPAAESKPPEPQ